MNKHTYGLAAATIALFAGSTALADEKEEHFDVWLRIVDGNLFTGAADEDANPLAPDVRVFGAEFGETPGLPFFADEPGFQGIDGTFDPGYQFRVDIVDAVQVWNGAGYSATPETMTLEFGPSSVTSGNGFEEGFIFNADVNGGFHDHFDIFINGDGGDPANGVYLLSLQIADVAGTYGVTDTFWFVMNLGMDEMAHDAAIEYVEDNLVPAPGALALLAILGCAGRGRRRVRGA